MWYILTIVSVVLWGFADMLSKKGTYIDDRYSYIRFVICACIPMLVFLTFFRVYSESGSTLIQLFIKYKVFFLITLFYVVSLLFSYFSFRYMEGSLNAPLCNTSAVMIILILLCFYTITGNGRKIEELFNPLSLTASIFVCVGVILIGYDSNKEENIAEKNDNRSKTRIKRFGAIVIIFPLLSAFFDALESVGDSYMVDESIGAGIGSIDYMRLWMAIYILCCIALWIYLFLKEKKPYNPFNKNDIIKIEVGFIEVTAYIIYIIALDNEPFFVSFLSSTYCVFSILFCHIFLKEKLNKWQYVSISLIAVGLALFGTI